MNLMQLLNLQSPVWAPQDDQGAPPSDPPPSDPPEEEIAAAPDDAASADDAAPAADFSFLPEQFRADGTPDIDGFKAHYDELAAQAAQREEALADVPEDATGYEFSVPEEIDFGDLDLPDDFGFELKADDPTLAPVFEEFGGLLHKYNLPKGAATEFMGALAKYQAAKFAPLYAESKAEMTALGKAAESRVADVQRALASRLPADLAKAMQSHTTTANGVKALEALLKPRGLKQTPATPPPAKSADDQLSDYYSNPTA